jgi:vacuolar-type H+-ATPase catalytic subunit A/Vma1
MMVGSHGREAPSRAASARSPARSPPLPGEVIRLEGERARIEVCAGTTDPRVGERVRETARPIEVEFGRALLGSDKTVLQQALAK